MNMKINYIDNTIDLKNSVNVIEIENKNYFYRFVNDLYSIYNIGYSDNISFFKKDEEKNLNGKIKIFINFFDFQFDSKKYINDLSKYVNENIDESDRNNLFNLYNKIIKLYKRILNNIDLPLNIEENVTIDNLTKLVKLSINYNNELLDNLLLLIDLEKALNTKNILIFVNLKQYLNKTELIEFYKYAVYNEIKLLLIDSQTYGTTVEYEKKLIIDGDLDEFML